MKRLVLSGEETAELIIEGHEFAVRFGASLDTDILADVLDLQLEIRRTGNKPKQHPDLIRRSKRLVLDIIRKEDPDPEELAFAERRSWSPSELYQVLALLSGREDGDAAAEVADALSDGIAPVEGAEPGDPTNSRRRSRSRRSASGKPSTSSPGTGEDSDGATSASISPMPTVA